MKMKEHRLTTFIRTKYVFQHRLKDLKDYEWVKVYNYELKNLGIGELHGGLLHYLLATGQIARKSDGRFKALNREGPVDPSLLEEAKRKTTMAQPELTPLHIWMRKCLTGVKLVGVRKDDIPVYFKSFLKSKPEDLKYFFKVDTFSTRVHTPVVSLKGDLRFKMRLYDEPVVSLDVKQMQPTILAKILDDKVGANSFSDAIFKGEDVYVHLKDAAKLASRKDAKEYFFQLVFGKPMNDIGRMFKGDTSWVDWINEYKRNPEPQNPHGKWKPHTNLAWLLQYSEVRVMTDVWRKLMEKNIPFLTIHDEILCKVSDQEKARGFMEEELRKHFKHFSITVHTTNKD